MHLIPLRTHVTKKGKTVIKGKDSVLKQCACNGVKAAVEAKIHKILIEDLTD
jgi:hypothetical protein